MTHATKTLLKKKYNARRAAEPNNQIICAFCLEIIYQIYSASNIGKEPIRARQKAHLLGSVLYTLYY
jgi:hypothetical protein